MATFGIILGFIVGVFLFGGVLSCVVALLLSILFSISWFKFFILWLLLYIVFGGN